MKYVGIVLILTPAWLKGDGVGHDVEGMAQTLHREGYQVYVYSPYFAHESYKAWCVSGEDARHLCEQDDTILIYHHSIGCKEIEDLLYNAKCKTRILRYHNVTPDFFFDGYSDDWVKNCKEGRSATYKIAKHCNYYITPSHYDARDLVNAGVDPALITYVPYFHKLEDFDKCPNDEHTKYNLENDSRLKVLFVGRRVNNKGHKHLVRIIKEFVQNYDNDVVLYLVGSVDESLKRYNQEIESLISEYGLSDNVVLCDRASFSEIVTFYRYCDAFMCTSEHEGFCIPIIEAQYVGLPVLAYYYGGVPEALGPTQLSFLSLNYTEFADALYRLRESQEFRERVGAAGWSSVRERFSLDDIQDTFLSAISRISEANLSGLMATERLSLPANRLRILMIVQRYGRSISGGAEAFARSYAERLSQIFNITVLTTTSQGLGWDNEIPVGPSIYDEDHPSLRIIRFNPVGQRDWPGFQAATDQLFRSEIQFDNWMSIQGPDVPHLEQYLDHHIDKFDLLINWTYLFNTSYIASKYAKRIPSILIPFLHDEVVASFSGWRDVFAQYDGFICQTESERILLNERFNVGDKPQIVLGSGIDDIFTDPSRNDRMPDSIKGPYLLYMGRVEPEKGVGLLVEWFLRFKSDHNSDLKLVLAGRPDGFEDPVNSDIIMTGFISEDQKLALMANALALVNPSENESFSLVLMEAWSVSTPVLVNAKCDAMVEHVRSSGGGLLYYNYADFVWSTNKLLSDASLCEELGRSGKVYYESNYRWDFLIPKAARFMMSFVNTN